MIKINEDECYTCGACVGVCPVGVLAIESGEWKIDHEGCIDCGFCVDVCPVGALYEDNEVK